MSLVSRLAFLFILAFTNIVMADAQMLGSAGAAVAQGNFHMAYPALCNHFLDRVRLSVFGSIAVYEGAGPIVFTPGSQDMSPMRTFPLDIEYRGEELGRSYKMRQQPVVYLDAKARQPYQVFIHEGKLVDRHGALICLAQLCSGIFVVDSHGRIYFSTQHSVYHFHHSSFLAGGPVAFAGTMKVKDGILQQFKNNSGHYLTERSEFPNMMARLRAGGVDMSAYDVPRRLRLSIEDIYVVRRLPGH